MTRTRATSRHPQRVLHYLDAIREEAGGVVRSVLDLCAAVAPRGVEVTLATFDPQDIPPAWGTQSPEAPRVVQLQRDDPGIAELVSQSDVVHLHTPWDRFNLRVAGLCRKQQVPYLVTPHGMLDDWSMSQKGFKKRVYWRIAARRLLEGAWRVHCTAEGEAQQARKWYPRGESAVLPLVVDIPRDDELPGPAGARQAYDFLAGERPTLLFLSRLHPKKGVELLLEATEQSIASIPQLQLVVAGPGEASYVESLVHLAHSLGIAERTHFVGMVQGDLKYSLYQACDLFVLPTQQENFGLVLPEAMLCSTPVVTTRGVDIWPEIAQAGGRVVDRTPEAFAATIVELLSDRERLAVLGDRCRQMTRQWLDPERVAASYVELYNSAANRSK